MLSKNLVGAAGEYYVCAELCRRGILALVTPKNNEIFDVLAPDTSGQRTISIQVKTMSIQHDQGWKFGLNMAVKKNNDNLYVVLVNMRGDGTNDFYIYQHDELVERVNLVYNDYITKPKLDGSVRKAPGFRWFDHKNFTEDDVARKNNWELLGFTPPQGSETKEVSMSKVYTQEELDNLSDVEQEQIINAAMWGSVEVIPVGGSHAMSIDDAAKFSAELPDDPPMGAEEQRAYDERTCEHREESNAPRTPIDRAGFQHAEEIEEAEGELK